MIYTVTLNPSLDYITEVEQFALHKTNRTSFEQMLPGGKGLNVSFVLKELGHESTATGFLAGFVGEEIKRRVEETGITADFIQLQNGCSRINMKIRNVDGTELNGMGPVIPEDKLQLWLEQMDRLGAGDSLVLAGSIPPSIPNSIYGDVMKMLEDRGVLIIVDATKELLTNVLPYHPFLIKPNHHELGELFGVTLDSKEAVVPYAQKLKAQGAENVLVSMGGMGAVLVDALGVVHMAEAPKGTVINSVGAGDSMVAGFLAGYLETKQYDYAFYKGLAAGSASAFSDTLATKEEVELLLKRCFKLC